MAMEPPGRVGLGLKSIPHPSYGSDPVLSTAPASPAEEIPIRRSRAGAMNDSSSSSSTLPPQTTMAQITFGPATQQTITTVTTTTTVSLPPLIIRPPRNLLERDPKQYPLAFSPTPHHIKRFCFDVNNHPTAFHEAEDPEETDRQYRHLLAKIHNQNGAIRQEDRDEGGASSMKRVHQQAHDGARSSAQKRMASPPSLAEAVEIASLQRRSKKPRSRLHRTFLEAPEKTVAGDRFSGGGAQSSETTPLTPDTNSAGMSSRLGGSKAAGTRSREPGHSTSSQLHPLGEDDVDMHDIDLQEEEDSQPGPPFYSHSKSAKRRFESIYAPGATEDAIGATPTPPVMDADLEAEMAEMEQFRHPNRPTFPSLLPSSQQDASLPSPSLSPITAAANLASRQNAFDASFASHIEGSTGGGSIIDADNTARDGSTDPLDADLFSRSTRQPSSTQSGSAPRHERGTSRDGPTIMDIPTMVDAFDSMPEAMQTYLMYQFLRRCAKPTLLMVASVVNPALKCDPFNILPPELSLNIARFLDAQSMCRAAQVSKRWRRLIITNEKAWKDLLERDEFTLPVDEISRAVREGWGWQHPGIKGYEEDLSAEIPLLSSDARDDSTISDDELTASSSTNSRSMKKRAKISGSKKAKRRTGQASSALVKPAATLQAKTKLSNLLDSAKGASAFAHAATVAIPHPSIGLDSLRNMHLFKSLYQRHYLIRKAWMSEKSKPKHLAFRAHHRHVVTCLLFDSDKILTGSDDTKINVYDTETGALRRRLDGHEGGVWALQYEGNMLVSGSTDRTVRVWDIEAGRCLQVFQGHTSTVRCLVILKPAQIGTAADGTPIMMPKEPLIITGSRDSTLRVWRLPGPHDANVTQNASPITEGENPYFLRTLAGHHNSVRAIAAHGDTLASGSYDCTVRVWKISTGDLVHRLAGHTSKVYSVVLDHARNRCISGSMDNFVKIWDLNNGTSLYTLDGHTSLVGLLDLSHDRLVSAAADSTLRLWDPETGAPRATLSAHTGAITCFQHDGQKVISGSDRTLKMWNVKNGEFVRDLLTDLSGVWQVRFDERRCVAAVQRNNLTYIEVLDFGASRDGMPESDLGRRIVVDHRGNEIEDLEMPVDIDMVAPAA